MRKSADDDRWSNDRWSIRCAAHDHSEEGTVVVDLNDAACACSERKPIRATWCGKGLPGHQVVRLGTNSVAADLNRSDSRLSFPGVDDFPRPVVKADDAQDALHTPSKLVRPDE